MSYGATCCLETISALGRATPRLQGHTGHEHRFNVPRVKMPLRFARLGNQHGSRAPRTRTSGRHNRVGGTPGPPRARLRKAKATGTHRIHRNTAHSEAPYLSTHFCTNDTLQNCHASDCSQTHVSASRVARHVVSRQPRLPHRPWHTSVPSTADVPTARGPDAAPVACGTPHNSCCCRCCCCCCAALMKLFVALRCAHEAI